jgi:hypothetical protein
LSRVSFFSIAVTSVVKNMSNESKITLPLSVENQIDAFLKKDEFEAFQELSDVFKQAVIEKSDLHMRRPKKDITFTFSRVAEILGIGSIKNRARQFKQIMKHANIFEWSDEIIDTTKPTKGGKQIPCEIWFTAFGFIKCFHVFPRNKFSMTMVNLSSKALVWALIAQKLLQEQLQKEIDAGYGQVEELVHELEQTEINLQETETNLQETETNLQDTTSDLVAREESPYKEFCALKGLPENYKQWGRRKTALYRLFASARDAGYTAKREGTCWYYLSEAGRTSALNSWE